MLTLKITAIVYETKTDNRLVANCHKIPSKEFNKRILKISEIIAAYKTAFDTIRLINPSIKTLFTVSPVRHIKDTIQKNAISKATLLLAIHEIMEQFQDVYYFPSYEIMLDDLRDYRFYADDMLHPSLVAEDYIWERLKACCFNEELMNFEKKWKKIQKSLIHKPFNSISTKHQEFLQKLLSDLENLSNQVNVDKEIEIVKTQIV